MKRTTILVAILLVLASLPVWAPRFWISVATQALIFAIFAMSLDLLLGYGGMPSFGHAAFYGVGAYATAYVALHRAPDLLPVLAVSVMAAALFALPIGALSLRTRGVYFLMLTLAFGQMLWGLAVQWTPVTGGTDGLFGIPRPALPPLDRLGISFSLPRPFYFLVLVLTVVSFLVLSMLIASPFGRTLEGIRENEGRMRALGCPTFRYRLAAFVIAGAMAGLAGSLAADFYGFANPSQLYWTTSGLVLIAAIVGGARSLVGPAVGAFFVLIMQTAIPSIFERWELLLGAVFIGFVLFLPGGIVGLVRRPA